MLRAVDREILRELNNLPASFFDFKEYTQDALTHGIHDYPAMFIYPIPRYFIQLVKKYQPEIRTFLDPFSGAGTALVEAVVAGLQAVGNDLNPLAALVGKAKSTVIEPERLEQYGDFLRREIEADYERYLPAFRAIDEEIRSRYDITAKKGWGDAAPAILLAHLQQHGLAGFPVPDFPNLGYWFLPQVILELQLVKNNLRKIDRPEIYTFFLAIFSDTVRRVSNRRSGEFKMYRWPAAKLQTFRPSVKDEFFAGLQRGLSGMKELAAAVPGPVPPCVILQQDTRYLDLPDCSIDLMITSPPYGDSRTTAAYGEFSRLSLLWLDLGLDHREIHRLDRKLLGGTRREDHPALDSETLHRQLAAIAAQDPKRSEEVHSYYRDLDQALGAITAKMKVNSYQVWVVGNRTVKKVNLATDRILVELGRKFHLHHVATVTRRIPNKRMPRENSPTNKVGEKVTTMNHEYIVVLRKEQ